MNKHRNDFTDLVSGDLENSLMNLNSFFSFSLFFWGYNHSFVFLGQQSQIITVWDPGYAYSLDIKINPLRN